MFTKNTFIVNTSNTNGLRLSNYNSRKTRNKCCMTRVSFNKLTPRFSVEQLKFACTQIYVLIKF